MDGKRLDEEEVAITEASKSWVLDEEEELSSDHPSGTMVGGSSVSSSSISSSSSGRRRHYMCVLSVAALIIVVYTFVWEDWDAIISTATGSITTEPMNMGMPTSDIGHYSSNPKQAAATEEDNGQNPTHEDDIRLQAIREKLSHPYMLQNHSSVVEAHQFLHLHHMKTGGTSINQVLECARGRLMQDFNYTVGYGTLHECSGANYRQCLNDPNSRCATHIQSVSLMSYCAPLRHLSRFHWVQEDTNVLTSVPSATVLRHPVDRVWSMFRFQTKYCYKCTPLVDVYKAIDAGTASDQYDDQCIRQLLNHQTANMLSTTWSDDTSNSDDNGEKLQQAITNLREFFTIVGLTEQLETTRTMLGMVFPWMSETIAGSPEKCPLPHDNASPQNNRCGVNGGHWNLPSHPDPETQRMIQEHNQLDMQLYEEAVQLFQMEKQVLGL